MSFYKIEKDNIFKIEKAISIEEFDCILKNENIVIERIISPNSDNPNAGWYNQEWDEWVMLVQGNAKLEYDDKSTIDLSIGDTLLIKKNTKHRVIYTFSESITIWLAIHIK
ncbi:MAG: cupin domain-containing protein [Bacteroidota bacterium]